MTDRIMMHLAGTNRPLTFDRLNDTPPILVSAGTAWAGPPVEVHAVKTVEDVGPSGPLDGERGLFVVLEGGMEIVVSKTGRDVVRRMSAGYVALLSGDERPAVVRVRGAAKVAAVHLPPEWFARGYDETPERFGRTKPRVCDETIRRLVNEMCDEIARGAPTGRLYAESLSTALISYALKHLPSAETIGQPALTGAQCGRLRSYVRERLAEDLSLDELAGEVGLGSRHFSRLFRRSFGTTPHQYVLQQRLAEAAYLLERGERAVSEIALQVGFASQSHFTTAFRKAFGVTPARYPRSKNAAGVRFQ